MSHTPGPWKVSRALWDADTGDVAYIFEGRKQARASDAWLINAVPDMKTALEWYEAKVRECAKPGRDGDASRLELDSDAGERARLALAKAKGEK